MYNHKNLHSTISIQQKQFNESELLAGEDCYSEVSNTRADRNKRVGWYFLRNL